MKITTNDIKKLAKITTRDEHDRHFTQVYGAAWLARMEKAGMITITRPVHAATGYAYSPYDWSMEVTEAAICLGESCNWGE